MLDWQRHKKLRIFIRTICVVLINSFVCYDLSWAGATEVLSPRNWQASQKTQNSPSIEIPQELGTVKESYTSKYNPHKLVIHIQDAHTNIEAQENEAKLIKYLKEKYKVNLVSVEGGFGDFNAEFFRSFPQDKKVREKIGKYFLTKAFISGTDYLLITEDEPPAVYGAEDKELYSSHLNTFRQNQNFSDSLNKSLGAVENALETLKAQYYSKDLKEFDSRANDFKLGRISLEEYLSYLNIVSIIHNFDLSKFPNLSRIINLQELERKINFEQAEAERQQLIDALTKALSKQDLEELVKNSLDFKVNKITSAEYYAYLEELAQKAGISSSSYKNLFSYIKYINLSENLDNSKILEEIDSFTETVRESLITNSSQKDIDSLTYIMQILKGLSSISLSPKDYEYFKNNRDAFSLKSIALALRRYTNSSALNSLPTDEDIASLEKFYSLAHDRDRAIVSNSLSRLNRDYGSNSLVLVAGGFHTQGITSILKEKDISYLVIAPNIKSAQDRETVYFSLLKDKKLPLQDVLNDPDTLQIINSISDPQARQLLVTYWVARASRYYSLTELQAQLDRLSLSSQDQQAAQLALREISPKTEVAKRKESPAPKPKEIKVAQAETPRQPRKEKIGPSTAALLIQKLRKFLGSPMLWTTLICASLFLGIPGASYASQSGFLGWAQYGLNWAYNNATGKVYYFEDNPKNLVPDSSWYLSHQERVGLHPGSHDTISDSIIDQTAQQVQRATEAAQHPQAPTIPHAMPQHPAQPAPTPETHIAPLDWIINHPLIVIGIFVAAILIGFGIGYLVRKYQGRVQEARLNQALKRLQEDIQKAQDTLTDTNTKVAEAQTKLKDIEGQISAKQKDLGQISGELRKATQETEKLTKQKTGLEEEIGILAVKKEQLLKELNDAQRELSQTQEALSRLQSQIKTLETGDAASQLQELVKLEQEAKQRKGQLQEELGILEQQQEKAKKETGRLAAGQEALSKDVDRLTQEKQALQSEISDLTSKKEQLARELADVQKELKEAKETSDNLLKEVRGLEERKSALTSEDLPRLEQERDRLRQEIEGLKIEKKELEEAMQRLKIPPARPPEAVVKPPEPKPVVPVPVKPVVPKPKPYDVVISDIDRTLTKTKQPFAQTTIANLLSLLGYGIHVALITAQGIEEVSRYFANEVETYLKAHQSGFDYQRLDGLTVYTVNGAQCWSVRIEKGRPAFALIYDRFKERLGNIDIETVTKAVKDVLGRRELPWFVTSGLDRKGQSEGKHPDRERIEIHERGAGFTIGNIPKSSADSVRSALLDEFAKQGWPLEVHKSSERTLHVLVSGYDKGVAVRYLLQERLQKIIPANPRILIMGDAFGINGLDQKMAEETEAMGIKPVVINTHGKTETAHEAISKILGEIEFSGSSQRRTNFFGGLSLLGILIGIVTFGSLIILLNPLGIYHSFSHLVSAGVPIALMSSLSAPGNPPREIHRDSRSLSGFLKLPYKLILGLGLGLFLSLASPSGAQPNYQGPISPHRQTVMIAQLPSSGTGELSGASNGFRQSHITLELPHKDSHGFTLEDCLKNFQDLKRPGYKSKHVPFQEAQDIAARLGELGDPRGVDVLIELAQGTERNGVRIFESWDQYVRLVAVEALGKVGGNKARECLLRVRETDPEESVCSAADQAIKNIDALANTSVDEKITRLINKLGDWELEGGLVHFGGNSMSANTEAIEALTKIGEPAVPYLVKAIEDGKIGNQAQLGAAIAIAKIAEDTNSPDLWKIALRAGLICYERDFIKDALVERLAEIGEPVISPVMELLSDKNELVRLGAISVLTKIGDPAIEPLKESLFFHSGYHGKAEALREIYKDKPFKEKIGIYLLSYVADSQLFLGSILGILLVVWTSLLYVRNRKIRAVYNRLLSYAGNVSFSERARLKRAAAVLTSKANFDIDNIFRAIAQNLPDISNIVKSGRIRKIADLLASLNKANVNAANVLQHGVTFVAKVAKSDKEFEEGLKLLETVCTELKKQGFSVDGMLNVGGNSIVGLSSDFPTFKALCNFVIELAKKKQNPQDLLTFVSPWAIKQAKDAKQIVARLNIILNLILEGIHPTQLLIEVAEKTTSQAELNKLISQWQKMLADFKKGKLTFDPKNPLHVDLEYTTFRQLAVQVSQSNSYESYLEIIRKFQTQTTASNLSAQEQAEVKFAVYEAFRLLEFIIAVKQKADQLGRPLWVVPNLSYGKFVVSPILDELAGLGVEVHYARVGSGESHENPTVVKPGLFSDENYVRILKEKPILVVVDGTKHTAPREGDGKASRYPDAYQGYRNFVVALDEVISEKKENRFLGKVPTLDKNHLSNLHQNTEYTALVDKLDRLNAGLSQPAHLYKLEFWNPVMRQLIIREVRREVQKVTPFNPNNLDSPTLIFVNSSMLDEDIPQEIKNWAKPQSAHTPAYFDDTNQIKSTVFAVNGRGVYLSHALEFEITKASQEIKSLYKVELPKAATQLPLPDAVKPDYEAMVFDLDGTLTETLKPIDDSLLDKLLLLLNSGVLIAIVTSQSLDEVRSHILDKISKDKKPHLENLFLYTTRGAKAFRFEPDGTMMRSYDRSTDIAPDQHKKLRGIVQGVLRDLLKEVEILDRKAQITIHLGKNHRDERDEIIQNLKQAIKDNNLPIEVEKAVTSTIHLVLAGVNKGEAVKHFLSVKAKQRLGRDIDPAKLLIVGDRFQEGESDRSMVIPGARVVSVGDKDQGRLPQGVEAYSDDGWHATHRLLAEIIHKPRTTVQVPAFFLGLGLGDLFKDVFSSQNLDTIGQLFVNAVSGFLVISFLILGIIASVRLFRAYRIYSKVRDAITFMGPLERFKVFREISSQVPWLHSQKIDPHSLLKDILLSLGESIQDERLSEVADLIARLSKAKINPRHVLKYGLPPISNKAKDKKEFIASLKLLERFAALLNDKRFDVHRLLKEIMPKLNKTTRTIEEFNEAVLLGINLLKSGHNPQVALCQILPEVITYTHSFSEYRMALYAVYRLIVEGFEPTKYLIRSLMVYAQENMVDKAVSDWQGLRRKFKSGGIAFDPKDQLHVNLEYTTFRELVDRTLKQPHRYSYQEYLSIIKNAEKQAAKAGLSSTEKAEIKYAAYEAFRLMQFILKTQRQAKAMGRQVWVVPNLSYGRFAVSPILRDLAAAGIEVHYARIGSSESHDNPRLVKPELFSPSLYDRIINEQPVIIVVDGTQHLLARPQDRKSARYPDAYVGYRNMIIAVNDIITRGKENVFKHLVKTRGRFIVKLRESRDYRALRRSFLRLYKPNLLTRPQLYAVEFWNPGGLELVIREARQERQRVRPVHASGINQPTLVFVNSVLLDEDLPFFMRHWAANGGKIIHKPAYFDDTAHIQSIIFDVDSRGIHLSDRLYQQLRDEYKKIKSVYEPALILATQPKPNKRLPYKIGIFDLDGTLADNLRPVPRQVLEKLLYLLQSGMQAAVVTTQSLKEIDRFLIRAVPQAQRPLLQNLILYPATGGQAWAFDNNGVLIQNPLYDVSKSHLTAGQNTLWRSIINAILLEYGLDKPLLDQKGILIAQPATIVDAGAQIIVRLNQRGDLRDEIVQRLSVEFAQAGLPLALNKIGRTSVQMTVAGIDKAFAVKFHLKEAAKRLGYEVEARQTLVVGNSFDGTGHDRAMIVKGAKVVSVGHRPVDRELRKGIEFYPIIGWQGTNYLFSEIINELKTVQGPAAPKPPAKNTGGYILPESAIILTGLVLVALSLSAIIAGNIVLGISLAVLGVIMLVIPGLISFLQGSFKPFGKTMNEKGSLSIERLRSIFKEAAKKPFVYDMFSIFGNPLSRPYLPLRQAIKATLRHPITVYYPGAYTDIAHPLLATDADVFLFVDRGETEKSLHWIIGAIRRKIEALGGRPGISYVVNDTEGVVNFEFAGRNRILFYYNNVDAANEENLPDRIKKGFDVYLEKALLTGYTGGGTDKSRIMPISLRYLAEGGFLLTDYPIEERIAGSQLKTVGVIKSRVRQDLFSQNRFTHLTYFAKKDEALKTQPKPRKTPSWQPRDRGQDLKTEAEYINQSYPGLKIGVIGATLPTKGYTSYLGEELGRRLKRYAGENGFVFTGGVAGVGVDVYRGVFEEAKGANQRFFVLLPEGVSPDTDYNAVSSDVRVAHIGKDMFERRIGMGKVADILIVLNGRNGTLHEAVSALKEGKKVIVLNYGGAGSLLYHAKAKGALSPMLGRAGLKLKYLDNVILADMDNIEQALKEAQKVNVTREKPPLVLGDPMEKALFTLDASGAFTLNQQAVSAINTLYAAYAGFTLEIDADALIDTSRGVPRLKGIGFREALASLYRAQAKKEIPEGLRIRIININPSLDRTKIIKALGLTDELLKGLVTIPEIPQDYLLKGLEPYLIAGSIRIIFEDNLRYWGRKVDVLVKRGKETEILSSLGLIVAALAKEPEFYQELPQDLKDYIVAVADEKGNIALDDQAKIKQLIFRPIEKTKVDTQYLDRLDKANKELEGMA